jgi:ANTAR domain-containing protein/GAF domain-containing protein
MNDNHDGTMSVSAVKELANVTTSLVGDHDVLGSVTNLLAGCERCLAADGSGIVVQRPDDLRLEFLAATSHRAEDIELYQAQIDQGPAADTIATGQAVTAGGTVFADRWPALADRFRARGFRSVYAHPMRWRGQTFGALNLFFASETAPEGTAPIAQAFSDLATMVVAHSTTSRLPDVAGPLRVALTQRILIEQAKGVLAYTENLTVDDAFDRLLRLAETNDRPLSDVAARIVHSVAQQSSDFPPPP